MKKRKLVVSIIAFLAVFALVLGGCSKKKAKVTEEEAHKILEGKVLIPDTQFKTKEEVEILFEAAKLKPKFVVANFDEVATKKEHFLRTNECNAVEDQPARKRYSFDEVGSLYGYYADENAEIIVQYSDHDFDGTVGKTKESSKEESKESSETKSSSDKKSGSSSSELPEDLKKKLEDLNAKYDEIIAQTQEFIDNPDSYTTTSSLEYASNQIEASGMLTEITTELEDYGISDLQSIKLFKDVYKKNLEVLTKMAELPEPTKTVIN